LEARRTGVLTTDVGKGAGPFSSLPTYYFKRKGPVSAIGDIERALQVARSIIKTKRPLDKLARPYKRHVIVRRQHDDPKRPYECRGTHGSWRNLNPPDAVITPDVKVAEPGDAGEAVAEEQVTPPSLSLLR